MGKGRKFYVVWAGHHTGIFDTWDECKEAVSNFPGARYKSFDSQEAAVEAYRGSADEHIGIIKAIAKQKAENINYAAIPEITLNSIAVDAGCRHNPGPVEYQGVDVMSGKRLFHVGPLEGGSNNMGEFLAIVHALAMLDNQNRHDVTIYTDSRTAMAWVRNRHAKTTIVPTEANARIRQLVARAEAWLLSHRLLNPIVKWETEKWGEIPADFGRK
ncbi:MAG: viroplasmin family protein [Muribaculaceae bacterium]|nr:viroplasmin family protein [Muribaculaceae bacterium]